MMNIPATIRTFRDFCPFLSTSTLLAPVGVHIRTFLRHIRTIRTYWNPLEPSFPCWGRKVLMRIYSNIKRVIKSKGNISKVTLLKKEEEWGIRNRAFQNFLFERKFFNAICSVISPAAEQGELT